MAQERAKELAAHEEQLEEWKKRFKAEALRQISEREKALADWQAQLEGSRAELEHLKENMEVGITLFASESSNPTPFAASNSIQSGIGSLQLFTAVSVLAWGCNMAAGLLPMEIRCMQRAVRERESQLVKREKAMAAAGSEADERTAALAARQVAVQAAEAAATSRAEALAEAQQKLSAEREAQAQREQELSAAESEVC